MATQNEIRNFEQGTNYFFEFVKLQKHYFHYMVNWFRDINDPRDINRIIYGTDGIGVSSVDGTGLFSFKEKHCEHCLKQEHTNKSAKEMIFNVRSTK